MDGDNSPTKNDEDRKGALVKGATSIAARVGYQIISFVGALILVGGCALFGISGVFADSNDIGTKLTCFSPILLALVLVGIYVWKKVRRSRKKP